MGRSVSTWIGGCMRKIAVDRSSARWQRLLLAVGVLVSVWGPAHLAEVAALDHIVDHHVDHHVESEGHSRSAGSRSVGSHDAVAAVPGGLESLGEDREPGERDDPQCGHRDAEHDATQATSVRLSEPDVVGGRPVAEPGDGERRRAFPDMSEPRAPPGQALLVVVCVSRQ